MNEKAYKVIEMVLNGASFSSADKEFGYSKNGSRAAFHSWIRRINPKVYDAGLSNDQLAKFTGFYKITDYDAWKIASPSIKYLRENKEHFLNIHIFTENKEIGQDKNAAIEKAIVLLVQNGYRVERIMSSK